MESPSTTSSPRNNRHRGTAPAAAVSSPRPLDDVERRISLALEQSSSATSSDDKRPSISKHTFSEKLSFGRRHSSVVTPHDLDAVRAAKQAEGEAFASGGETRFYGPIDSFEGRHRWDPKAEWTEQEEKQVALTDNFLSDLGLNTNQYNYGQSIFYISFLCAELPSQMISKKLGPDNWIPIQMVCWSIVAICQCKLSGEKSFYVTRLSYFYKTKELPIRLSFFWSSYILTQVVSAFLAFGILRLRGHSGWEGWRWLFALEGILTVLIGVASWFYLPPSPTQTASKFRGKDGWFSEREEVIMVNRILRDDPSKGDMHNRQGLSLKLFRDALTDWDLFPQTEVNADPFSARQSRNLESLAKAAQKFHATASSTASTRYSTPVDRRSVSNWGGSEAGSLTQAQRERIEVWNSLSTVDEGPEDGSTENTHSIPTDNSTTITSPDLDDLRSDPGKGKGVAGASGEEAADSDDDSDVELDFLRNFEELAYSSFVAQDYSKAEQCLRMAVERSTDDMSSTADFRLLKIKLALCCCLQEKWDHAAGIVASLSKARSVANIPVFHLLQAISLAHLQEDRFEDAYNVCKTALQGKKKVLGKTSPDCYGCLTIYAAICDKKGDALEAEAVRHSIPRDWFPPSSIGVLSPRHYILRHETRRRPSLVLSCQSYIARPVWSRERRSVWSLGYPCPAQPERQFS
ncbi:hypothetical protein OQA88_11060 [Cercophora sp. LCS_1]